MTTPEPPHMWGYWRDKYGIADALKDYYPELLKGDPVLSAAVAQLRMAELAIEARMQEIAHNTPDED